MNIADSPIPTDGPDAARAETLLEDVIRADTNSMVAHAVTGVLRRLQGRLHDAAKAALAKGKGRFVDIFPPSRP